MEVMRTLYCLGLAIGLALSTRLTVLPAMPWAWFGAGLSLLVCLGVKHLPAGRWGSGFLLCILCCGVMGLGLGVLQGHRLQAGFLPQALEGQSRPWQGCVLEYPQARLRGQALEWRLQLRITAMPAAPAMTGGIARLSTAADASAIRPGQCFQLEGTVKRPRGLASPGAMAYDGWLLAQGVRMIARSRALEPLPNSLNGWAGLQVRLRTAWRDHVRNAGFSPPSTRLLLAILAGDASAMTDADWQVLQATGTTHVFVVSGLHIGLLAVLGAGLGYVSGLLLSGLWPAAPRVLALLMAMLAAWGFCVASGSGVAACRSALMFSVAAACLLFGRPQVVWRAICVSAVLILLWNPWQVYLPGFWLSFMAVLALCVVLLPRRPAVGYVRGLLWAQWAIALGLLPFLLWFGKPMAVSGVPVNLLLLPLVSLWVPVNAALLLLAVWLPLPAWLLSSMDALNEQAWQGLVMASEWGERWWPVPSFTALLCLCVAALVCLLPCRWPLRVLCVLMVLPWWFPAQPSLVSGEWRLHVLDVGQGQAVIVQTANHTLVYDAGPAMPEGWDAAEAVIWPMLGQLGIHRLERILISHGDNDHAGGLPFLRARFPQAEVWQTGLPGQGQPCAAGEYWQWDGVDFRILHPQRDAGDGNNSSCVLRIGNGRFTALLPGDIEREAEYRLLGQGVDVAADWLLVPHHGSRTSSSWPFAKRVSPEQVVYSAGFGNRFGHPVAEVVERWQLLGAGAEHTAHCGTYSLKVDRDGQWQASCYRRHWKPWWRDR